MRGNALGLLLCLSVLLAGLGNSSIARAAECTVNNYSKDSVNQVGSFRNSVIECACKSGSDSETDTVRFGASGSIRHIKLDSPLEIPADCHGKLSISDESGNVILEPSSAFSGDASSALLVVKSSNGVDINGLNFIKSKGDAIQVTGDGVSIGGNYFGAIGSDQSEGYRNAGAGVRVVDADHVQVTSNVFIHNGTGVVVDGLAKSATLTSNTFGMLVAEPQDGGIHLLGDVRSTTMELNLFTSREYGLKISDDAKWSLIQFNTFQNNFSAIVLDGSPSSYANTIGNNNFYSSWGLHVDLIPQNGTPNTSTPGVETSTRGPNKLLSFPSDLRMTVVNKQETDDKGTVTVTKKIFRIAGTAPVEATKVRFFYDKDKLNDRGGGEAIYMSSIAVQAEDNQSSGSFRIKISTSDPESKLWDLIPSALEKEEDTLSFLAYQPSNCDDDGSSCDYSTSEFSAPVPLYLEDDGDGYAPEHGDCNDANADVYPGAPENCSDGIDNNCDGLVDGAESQCAATDDEDGDGYTTADGDCDDTNADSHPDAEEVCGGAVDLNCDGALPAACPSTNTYYPDLDNDGYGGVGSTSIESDATEPPEGYSATNDDCNDADASVNPGAAEVAGDGVDNNCDGATDTYTYYPDLDGDGYGGVGSEPIESDTTEPPDGYSATNDDCNDANPAAYPGAPEACGGTEDLNCDGVSPDACPGTDADGDGSVPPADCDDADPTTNPDATELCDGKDNDCDGVIDDGLPTVPYYEDADSDGYGNPDVSVNACAVPDGMVSDSTDCDDTNANAYPGAPSDPGDGIDNDCDGEIDENAGDDTYYADADGDGFGDSDQTVTDDGAPAGYVDNDDDCDDANSVINPAATEICNLVDDNCNGETDETCVVVESEDKDNDGYSDATLGGNDCDDYNSTIYPGAPENLANGIDDNCNGEIDEDIDGDGDGQTPGQGDCNDADASVHLGAEEIDGDGIDNNCNGYIDSNDDIDETPDPDVGSIPFIGSLNGGCSLAM